MVAVRCSVRNPVTCTAGGAQVQGGDPEQALGPAQRQVRIDDLLHQERRRQLQPRPRSTETPTRARGQRQA